VKDAKAEDLTRQPEQIKAFRDTWELGIHSYLTYLRDRLAAARDLLTESGSIFVQIGDENVHRVRALMDEVFGDANFCGEIIVGKTPGAGMEHLDLVADYILFYAKNKEQLKFRTLFTDKTESESIFRYYRYIELSDGSRRAMLPEEVASHDTIPAGARIYSIEALTSQTNATTTRYDFEFQGEVYASGVRQWATPLAGMERLVWANRVTHRGNSIGFIRYLDDFPVRAIANIWSDISGSIQSRSDPKVYVVQTSTNAVQRCLLMTTDPGDLVLDPTCGSGTTAYVAEQWGRRWITIDTSRVALALARTRLMAARFPYYLLADSPEGRKKQAELTGTSTDPNAPPCRRDMHKAFIYRTVPHVTLKSIANNPDIKVGITREEIDKAIARHAENETLYDQPYEDKGIVRVTGPFTVESLSPHRSLPTAAATPVADSSPNGAPGSAGNFLVMILDNLRKAGVKGTDKKQRITFARLDPFPGEHVHAEGETDTGAAVRVSIGPEFGTVGDADIKKAALEAIKGSKCDLLLVCAFAFEPSVHEQTAELTKEIKLGKLAILPVRMNPDLAMGDELLKKTGAGNLFTVFGEPDVKVTNKDGKVVVTIRGVDVFDPTTGAVRTGGTDDIACWFIDSDYDGQSFFVRHAYFLYGGKGTAEGPYDKLRKALRAEIDEGEWSKLYSATSQPFDPPKSGKIAVKVINHYGDEMLKVFPMPAAEK
jgi:adenine-specific DNA-methyltransferase